ncbi:hypothetical protein F2P56_012807 [Juglans regia]|uniref:Transcription factor MYB114-like n=2 Tax=Juglans regia TaxID=51240 RepID=A0A833XKG6_JUGRE|nr:transcription factor MYB4-like [Juglans regia]KAF5468668.1 hypothetical protein F2P56_012807 [Juglans regia]
MTSTQLCTKRDGNRGAWTAEEDQKLARVIEIQGPKRWKIVAAKAGLNRSGKSCRLRWMNYLRPNIKRGNISDQEEDLILRLHKLLGNRWSLIAGRLPGRTDNEIKNYWNSRLSKKIKQKEKQNKILRVQIDHQNNGKRMGNILNRWEEGTSKGNHENSKASFNGDDFFNSSREEDQGPSDLEWMSKLLEMDASWFKFLHDI